MGFEEDRPWDTPSSGGSGFDQVVFEDSTDRSTTDFDVQVYQGALDPSISPTRILVGHLDVKFPTFRPPYLRV